MVLYISQQGRQSRLALNSNQPEDDMLTMAEKREVGRYLRTRYGSVNGRGVRFGNDGAVTIMVDAMPNTNQRGRIFCGWDSELLAEARRDA